MIKDQIMQNNYKSLGSRCFSCQEPDHLIKECSRIHFVPNKEKIVKSRRISYSNHNHISLLANTNRNYRMKFNARKGTKVLSEIRELFLQTMGEDSLSLESSFENLRLDLNNNSSNENSPNAMNLHSRKISENSDYFNKNIKANNKINNSFSAIKSPIIKNDNPKLESSISQKLKNLFLPVEQPNFPHSNSQIGRNFMIENNPIEEEKNEYYDPQMMENSYKMNAVQFFGKINSGNLENNKKIESTLEENDMKNSIINKNKPPMPRPLFKQKTEICNLKKAKIIRGSSKKLLTESNKGVLNRRASIDNTKGFVQRKVSKKLTQNSSINTNLNNDNNAKNIGNMTNINNDESDLLNSFDKMYNFKSYFPDGNLFNIITAINLREKKRKREQYKKNHNNLVEYFKRAKTKKFSIMSNKKMSQAKNKILPDDQRLVMSPGVMSFDKNERNSANRTVSNIFRDKVDGKSFFQKNKKISFYDVVFQILTNKELRKNLQDLKEKKKKSWRK